MNKKKIIKKAAINADLTVKEGQKTVEAFLCAVSDILKEDREVFLPDFGRFYVRKCAERKAVERPEDMTIRVYPCGNRWAAIDKDVDRIFEAFGWQTGCVWDGEDLVSWIFIGKAGLEVLRNSDYDVKVMDFGEFDITYIYFEEDIISTVQQVMDCNWMLGKNIYESRKLMMRMQPYAAMCHGYKELMSANITIEDDKLYGEMPDGSKDLLYDGKCWRLDDVGRQMVIQMGAQMGAAQPY